MKKTVALIFGGEGYEHEISLLSAAALSKMIDRSVYEMLFVGISKSGEWYIYVGNEDKIKDGLWLLDKSSLTPTYPVRLRDASGFLAGNEVIPVYAAIPCLHGDFGEDGHIQAALRAAQISYVGEDVFTSALTADKAYTKAVAEHLGIPTARWISVQGDNVRYAMHMAEEHVGYPMFIKPARLGSSYGASPVYTAEDFGGAFANAIAYADKIIIEELIAVDYELECAVLNTDKRRILPCGRILSHGKFYDFSKKYEVGDVKTEAVRGFDKRVEQTAGGYAEALSDFIGIRHLSRIDFLVTKEKKIYFNEINAFPGMTEASLYPLLTELSGLKRGDFINLLIEKAHNDRSV